MLLTAREVAELTGRTRRPAQRVEKPQHEPATVPQEK